VTKIDADHIRNVKLQLNRLEEDAFVNFVESIASPQTRRNYIRDIQVFLKLIPSSIFEEYEIKHNAGDFQLEDRCEAFVALAKKDTSIIKNHNKVILD